MLPSCRFYSAIERIYRGQTVKTVPSSENWAWPLAILGNKVYGKWTRLLYFSVLNGRLAKEAGLC